MQNGGEKQEKMVLQFTRSHQISSMNRNTTKLAMLNHNQQENSNWIMPFLVQNDTMIKGPTT